MRKHTPGPWMVGPVDDTTVTHMGKDGVRYVIAEIDGDYNQPDTWPIMEANARLIAAAPELLEALVAINVMLSPGTRTFDEMIRDVGYACDRARAAIAKAKGEA